tara:strand:+ start:163 stop:375 length:213 start_codon:yes stop_codon:yes gene_type:complete
MGNHESENENEITTSDLLTDVNVLRGNLIDALKTITTLEERLTRVERAYDALGRRLEGSERHVEDEGWFD